MDDDYRIAKAFHEAYEALAPVYHYRYSDRALLVAARQVAADVLDPNEASR